MALGVGAALVDYWLTPIDTATNTKTAAREPPEGWNHNTLYHGAVLDAVPPDCRRALDVGCGEGTLTRKLRRLVADVVGIDRNEAALTRARAHPGAGDILYVKGDALTYPFEPCSFDLVTAVASLHQMDAGAGLRRMRDLLRPGGVLAVVGLARSSPLDLVIDAAAIAPNRVRRRRNPYWEPAVSTISPPPEAYASMRALTERVLPGARFRRRLYWRYTVVWIKPQQ